jgi:hypothetical protein
LFDTLSDCLNIEKKVNKNTHQEIALKNCLVTGGRLCSNIKNNRKQTIQTTGVMTLGENMLFFETIMLTTNNKMNNMSKTIIITILF